MDYFRKHFRYGRKRLAMMLTLCMIVAASAVTAFAKEESKHTLTWMIDGEVLEEQEYQEGEAVTPPEAPEKDKFLFKEWQNLPEAMPGEDLTVTGVYQFAGTLVTGQENVYKSELKMSEDMSVTMYLRMDADGNFVFSRSTDFSDTEKGAGKVYKWTPGGSLQSGKYAVDISWSPMADTLKPVLEIDADAMTFQLYGSDDPDTGKGSGSISYEDDVYTMHFADSEDTTTFIFEDGALTFTSKLWYGTASFNREDEAGSFLTYTAEQTETEEGQTEAPEEQTEEEEQEEHTDGVRYYLVYYVVNGEAVAEGDYITEIDLSDPDTVRFLSPFWFGATEPKLTGKDGMTVEYPEFTATNEEITADINKDAIVSKSTAPADSDAAKTKKNAGETGSFRTGTYGASHKTTAMGQPLTYACTITFRADGSYTYQVRFQVMGKAYSESESGTYKVSGGSITLVSGSGKTMTGSVGGNTVTITRKASSFAFADAAITFTYGYSPSPSSSTSGNGSGKETEKQTEKQTEQQTETDPAVKPSVSKEGLTSGNYDVDISWSPMGAMISPVLRIDADAMTFQLYNKGASGTVKGSGTISHKNGVFTLNYSDGHKTTFTAKDSTLSFTSKLWYGTASFNNTDASGTFVPYTAQLRKTEETGPSQPGETDPEQPQETEKPQETEPSGTETVPKTGTYSATLSKMAMGKEVIYTCTMTLNADGTYQYTVKFNMMGNPYEQTENGTYTADGSALTFTAEDGTKTTGMAGDESTFAVTRKASSFASALDVLKFTFGAPAETEKPEETELPGETEQPQETEPSQPGETNPEQTLVSGNYSVDISSTAMAGVFSPILTIDAEKNTFNLYNDGTPQTSKGSGTITKENEVYTLHYADSSEKTTSLTFADGVITFRSRLWYGGSSFNNVDAGGNFVPFTAKKTTGTGGSDGQESEKETEPEGSGALKTGSYAGTYVQQTGNIQIPYTITMTFREDHTYTYTVKYDVQGAQEDTETGSYVADGTKVTLTAQSGNIVSAGTVMNATVTSDTTVYVKRTISSKASKAVGIMLTFGSQPGGETKPDTKPDTAVKAGTYGGTLSVSAGPMGTMTYVYSLTLNADNTYLYNVKYTAMGTQQDESESGIYRVAESKIYLTPQGGEEIEGSINTDGSLTITRSVSISIKGTARELKCVYGYTASTVTEQMTPEKSIQAEPETAKESETEMADTEPSTETEAMTEQESQPSGENAAETERMTEMATETATETESTPEKETEAASGEKTETAAAPETATEPETEKTVEKETEKRTEKTAEKTTEKTTEKATEDTAE